jgi:processing peptidase subunit alpha
MKGELLECAERIEAEELQRAKNQLKSSLLMSLESRVIQFDDIGRQVRHSTRPQPDVCVR